MTDRATFVCLILVTLSSVVLGDEFPNLNAVPADLVVPEPVAGEPAAGRRVAAVTKDWAATDVHHTLYLPRDWKPRTTYPVIVEYAGNGGYRNNLGDVSEGTVEGCLLGYGLSGGEGFIWVCMPFVEVTADGTKRNSIRWWGDIEESKRYCIATVKDICDRFGGDPSNVVLCGFSRGSIACNYIGLHDDEITKLWRAFFCHSHYDGVRTWPHADLDAASALKRLERLRGRKQWISHEKSVLEISQYLEKTGVQGDFEIHLLPYVNHTAGWVLRDIPERRQAREWLARAVSSPAKTE